MDKSQVAYMHRGWRGILLLVNLEMLAAPGFIVSGIWNEYCSSLVALISGGLDIGNLDIESAGNCLDGNCLADRKSCRLEIGIGFMSRVTAGQW
jgi:hypothetical protein